MPFMHGLGDAADVMSDDRRAVGGGFEVDEAEALDAAAVVDARHREDVCLVVDGGEL